MNVYWRIRRALLRFIDRLRGRRTFFRAVSIPEYLSICQSRRLTLVPASSAGKHLAVKYEAACEWGRRLHKGSGFRVVAVSFPESVATDFYSWTNLDGIGAAAFAEQGTLEYAILTPRVDDQNA